MGEVFLPMYDCCYCYGFETSLPRTSCVDQAGGVTKPYGPESQLV